MQQDSSASRRSHTVVEIATYWGSTPLGVQTLEPPSSFWVGESAKGEACCDVAMDEHLLGAPRVALVRLEPDGGVRLCLLPNAEGTIGLVGAAARPLAEVADQLELCRLSEPVGACEVVLPRGARAHLRLGELAFRISVTRPAERIRRRGLGRTAWALAGCCALSLVAHTGLGSAAYLAHEPGDDDAGTITEEQRYLMQYYLDRIEERRLEEAERETEAVELGPDQADNREGGAGTRARGEEGSMGASRYGVVGPASRPAPVLHRQAALRGSSEFGMIGLLRSGAGGDPDAPTSPWGRDDSLGTLVPTGQVGSMGHGAGAGTGQGFGSGRGRGGGGAAGLGLSRASAGSTHAGRGRLGRSQPSPARVGGAGTWAAPLAAMPIDPNGRFSTTYRPGQGHLAAFEAAVARGVVPVSARQLVADVGARYAPDLAAPRGAALAHAVDLERSALGPEGGSVHVRIALRSSAASPTGRPRLSVHLVLDQSGSMEGEPIERAKQAAQVLVDRLEPSDELSLITFDDEAHVRVPTGFVGPRKAQIQRAIAQIESSGGTNIGEALAHAYRQAGSRTCGCDAIPVVLLLSDGQPTVGERSPQRLSAQALEAFQDGVQTSTFGLGNSYDGNLMSAVASDGAGGYYYLRDSEQIGSAFRAELAQRLDPAATAVELRVRLAEDVQLLHVYGSRRLGELGAARVRVAEVAADAQAQKRYGIERDRQQDRKGGMRFFIPAFARDDAYSLLLKVGVPAGERQRRVGVLEIRYKDRLRKRNVTEERIIEVAHAESDGESAATINPSVARTVQGHRAGEDLLRAAWLLARGDRAQAITTLKERELVLREAAESLDEPGLSTDANRFGSLLAHLAGERSGAIQEPYALAMVLETAGRSHLR